MKIEVRHDGALTAAEREYLNHWSRAMFGAEAAEYKWSDVDWHVLVWNEGEIVTHVEIVDRMGTVDGRPVRLGGIGGVAAATAWRGRGLASAAVARAGAFMRGEMGVEFGLLVCGPKMVGFYGRLGWQEVEGPLLVDQPGGKVELEGPVMVLPCQEQRWPGGAIDLCGLPW
jgi:aminoglycoside 2'-N-acetyltransferase I